MHLKIERDLTVLIKSLVTLPTMICLSFVVILLSIFNSFIFVRFFSSRCSASPLTKLINYGKTDLQSQFSGKPDLPFSNIEKNNLITVESRIKKSAFLLAICGQSLSEGSRWALVTSTQQTSRAILNCQKRTRSQFSITVWEVPHCLDLRHAQGTDLPGVHCHNMCRPYVPYDYLVIDLI